jgi:hypothetical protein
MAQARAKVVRWLCGVSALLALVALGLLVAGCGGAPATTVCGGAERQTLACDSEVAYQGIRTKGGASFLDIVGAEGEYQETAIRRINEHVEKYAAAQRRLCDEYNKCVIDGAKYHAEAERLRAQLTGLGEAADKLAKAGSYGERKHILGAMYAAAVPDSERVEECTLELGVEAQLPAGVGDRSGPFTLEPNEPLPTGALVAFEVATTPETYLYIVQDSTESGVGILFPHTDIGLKNPMPSGKRVRIPPGSDRFELDDKDLGTEWLYIVVSRKPVARMDDVMKHVASGKVKRMADDETLATLKKMAPGKAPDDCKGQALAGGQGCTRSRGLVGFRALMLKKGAVEDPRARRSFSVITDPGDDTIVKAFPYRHVAKGEYDAAVKKFRGERAGEGERGIVIEN